MINRYEQMHAAYQQRSTTKRFAAYCRVSTDKDDQTNSFESQQRYFKQYIEHNPEWELYDIFADEGLSGTSTRKRKEFNRMIACARNGAFDMIITKEISRFARNTLDSIYYTRELKKYGVGVIFLNDGINTLEPDAELRLTIMASIAQEESRKTSERVKWGQKRRMEQGVVFGRSMLGYDVADGKMTINEEGAETVRLIFHKVANEKKGTHVIARELREAGIYPMRCKQWTGTVILRVIRNEKYCGDLVQKKTYTPDYLSHDKKYNRGQEEFVILRDHHEPIVSRELFEKANRILDERAPTPEAKSRYSNRYPFSGKIKCGRCGASYVARYKNRKDGSRYKAWRCFEAANHGRQHIDSQGNVIGCSSNSIRNEDAVHIMRLVCESLCLQEQKLIKELLDAIDSVISADVPEEDTHRAEQTLEDIKRKQERLLELYLNQLLSKEEFTAAREAQEQELARIKGLLSKEKPKQTEQEYQMMKQDIITAVHEIISGMEHDDVFYAEILNKMVVYDRDTIGVTLNLLPNEWKYTVKKAFRNQPKKQEHFGAEVGTEELAHTEMIGAIVYQLTRCLTPEQIKKSGFDAYFVDHTNGIYPQAASGVPFSAATLQSTGDAIADLFEDLAAEQKARLTYDNLLRLVDDPDVRDPLKFLREREIVHFQRFGEALRDVQEQLDSKNYYAYNPSFDTGCAKRYEKKCKANCPEMHKKDC